MNLSSLEQILISGYRDEMVNSVQKNPDIFTEAVELALTDKQPFSWRAAWLVKNCMTKNDKRIIDWIDVILNSLHSKKDGHIRELLKILYAMELNREQELFLFDYNMRIWENTNWNPSLRVAALKFLIKLLKKYKILEKEDYLIFSEKYLITLTHGARRSAEKLISALKIK